jgi:pimeloyl-ACP methyl ester carboxylesterase
VNQPGLPLYVDRMGRPPGPGIDTFLLIHGYAASRFSWRRWMPSLAERGHVVAVDMKGFGQAPKPDDGRYSPEDQALLLDRLIRREGLDRLTLVGHSLGGGVALLTALRLLDHEPARLRRLIIVAGAAYEQRLPPFVGLASWPTLSGALFRLLGPDRIVRHVLRTIVDDAARVTEKQVSGYADPLRATGTLRALLSTARQIVPPDLSALTARYPEIGAPTLLIWGRRDRVVPLAVGQRLAQAIPDARLHVLEACGHLPAEEKPQESLAVVEAFLEETSGLDS